MALRLPSTVVRGPLNTWRAERIDSLVLPPAFRSTVVVVLSAAVSGTPLYTASTGLKPGVGLSTPTRTVVFVVERTRNSMSLPASAPYGTPPQIGAPYDAPALTVSAPSVRS